MQFDEAERTQKADGQKSVQFDEAHRTQKIERKKKAHFRPVGPPPKKDSDASVGCVSTCVFLRMRFDLRFLRHVFCHAVFGMLFDPRFCTTAFLPEILWMRFDLRFVEQCGCVWF